MFGRIVPRYDRLNRVMSGGLDGGWRRAAARAAAPAGALALDLGAGTGDQARALLRAGAARVYCVDFARPMVMRGREKHEPQEQPRAAWLQADALTLPFPDASFDALTSAFLLRNLVDLPAGLAEMLRVLRPGGRVVSLEITPPPPGPRGALLRFGFARVVTPLAGLISGERAAYRYLPDSLAGFPTAPVLVDLMAEAGAEAVRYRRLGGGIMALHWGRKPATR